MFEKILPVLTKMMNTLNLEDFIVLVEAMVDELNLLQLDGGVTVNGIDKCVKMYLDPEKNVWLPDITKCDPTEGTRPSHELIKQWAEVMQHNWKRIEEEPELFQYIMQKSEAISVASA